MGSKLSRAVHGYMARHDRRLLLVGLDGAGKSTVLKYIRKRTIGNETFIDTHSNTNGGSNIGKGGGIPGNNDFDVETIPHGKLRFHLWDIRGQDHMRPYWRHYYTGTQGIIFVVDAADINRLDAAAAELRTLAADGQLFDAAILVLANKSDMNNALSAEELSQRMNLPLALAGHPWHIQNSVASTGAGIEEGLVFLAENMKAL